MNRTTLTRLAALTLIAAGGTALARPALAATVRTACDQKSVDNIATSAEDYCHAQGFDSAQINFACSGGQITSVTVTCFNYN